MAHPHPDAKPTKKKPQKAKTIYKVDSPFTSVTWPQLSPENEATILDILCPLLAPIGTHRITHIHPSKGIRARKRKRRPPQQSLHDAPDAPLQPARRSSEPPAPPELAQHLLVGLNTITRHLESLANPSLPQSSHPTSTAKVSDPKRPQPKPGHPALVFLPQPRDSIIYAHLPLLSQLASVAYPSYPPIRLLSLKPAAEERLVAALGLPRVGALAVLEDAPDSAPLTEFVRAHVPPVQVPWLEEAKAGRYRELKIGEVEMSARDGTGGVDATDDGLVKGQPEPRNA